MQPGCFNHEFLFFLGQESRDRNEAKTRCQYAQGRYQEIGALGQDQTTSFTFPASAFEQSSRQLVSAINELPIGYVVALLSV